jgi:hypothetical protein
MVGYDLARTKSSWPRLPSASWLLTNLFLFEAAISVGKLIVRSGLPWVWIGGSFFLAVVADELWSPARKMVTILRQMACFQEIRA